MCNMFIIFVIFVSLTLPTRSDEFNNILVNGNERISDETILLFSELSDEKFLSEKSINDILKKIYQSGFFKDVVIKIENKSSQVIFEKANFNLKSEILYKNVRSYHYVRNEDC